MAIRKRELKSGTKWFVDIRLPNGKRIRRSVGTKKQAEEVAKKITAEMVEGKWGIREKRDITFDKLTEDIFRMLRPTRLPVLSTLTNAGYMVICYPILAIRLLAA